MFFLLSVAFHSVGERDVPLLLCQDRESLFGLTLDRKTRLLVWMFVQTRKKKGEERCLTGRYLTVFDGKREVFGS